MSTGHRRVRLREGILAAAGPLALTGFVSEIALDSADPTMASVYLALRRDGRQPARLALRRDKVGGPQRHSGSQQPAGRGHNALVVDPWAPANLYVGADVGVWHSSHGALNWHPHENGLPAAPVYDLQIHPTQRLLRAATHGRGVYEIPLT